MATIRRKHNRLIAAMSSSDVADHLRLCLVSGVGPRIRQALLDHFGSPAAVLSAAPSELRSVQGVGPQLTRRIRAAGEEIDVEQELDLCRRYHEAAFPSAPVGRLVFVGGEARHRGLCQQVARGLMLAAQVGDPLVRMGRISDVGIESGIDRRQPQPAWAVAIGLSMGPVNSGVVAEATK